MTLCGTAEIFRAKKLSGASAFVTWVFFFMAVLLIELFFCLYFQMGSKSGKWKHQWTKIRASRCVFGLCLGRVSSFRRFLTADCFLEYVVCGGAGLQRHVRLPICQSQLLRHQRQEEAQPASTFHFHPTGR